MALMGALMADTVVKTTKVQIEKNFELIMFSTSLCNHCAVFDQDVAKIYKKHQLAKTAPLVKVNLDEAGTGPYILNKPIDVVPTFVIMKNGKEIGRLSGMMNKLMFLTYVRDTIYPTTQIANR